MSGCIHETNQPRELRRRPLTEVFVRDPAGDFIITHPLFQETFDVEYGNIEMIPSSLDIRSVEISLERDQYVFQIRTGGERLRALFEEQQRTTRFGIYMDRDFNGVGDVFVTTTDQPNQGLVLTYDFEVLARTRTIIEPDSVTLYVPQRTLGQSFDWLAFSGYSPRPGAFHPTPLDNVFFVPVVDLVRPRRWPRVTEIWAAHFSGGQCQVIESGYHTCPVYGATPTNVPHLLPGGNPHQGVMIHRIMCGNRGHELWCISGCFARRPFNTSWQGWIARCPYPTGNNFHKHLYNPITNVLERVIHTVMDGPYIAPKDTDGDGYFDVMVHDYQYNTNQVTSCNLERDLYTKALKFQRCDAPRQPYTNSYEVPGYIGVSGTP